MGTNCYSTGILANKNYNVQVFTIRPSYLEHRIKALGKSIKICPWLHKSLSRKLSLFKFAAKNLSAQ